MGSGSWCCGGGRGRGERRMGGLARIDGAQWGKKGRAGKGRRAPVCCGHGGYGGSKGRRRQEVGDGPDVWAPSVGEREGGWEGVEVGRLVGWAEQDAGPAAFGTG
jgi:hypothetical protein